MELALSALLVVISIAITVIVVRQVSANTPR
jgi:hypothetical protein